MTLAVKVALNLNTTNQPSWNMAIIMNFWLGNGTVLKSSSQWQLKVFWKLNKSGHELFLFIILLILSQTTNLQLFQTESICRGQFPIWRKFLKQVEKNVRKGEIARYEQFLLFPQCFQKICTADT